MGFPERFGRVAPTIRFMTLPRRPPRDTHGQVLPEGPRRTVREASVTVDPYERNSGARSGRTIDLEDDWPIRSRSRRPLTCSRPPAFAGSRALGGTVGRPAGKTPLTSDRVAVHTCAYPHVTGEFSGILRGSGSWWYGGADVAPIRLDHLVERRAEYEGLALRKYRDGSRDIRCDPACVRRAPSDQCAGSGGAV